MTLKNLLDAFCDKNGNSNIDYVLVNFTIRKIIAVNELRSNNYFIYCDVYDAKYHNVVEIHGQSFSNVLEVTLPEEFTANGRELFGAVLESLTKNLLVDNDEYTIINNAIEFLIDSAKRIEGREISDLAYSTIAAKLIEHLYKQVKLGMRAINDIVSVYDYDEIIMAHTTHTYETRKNEQEFIEFLKEGQEVLGDNKNS